MPTEIIPVEMISERKCVKYNTVLSQSSTWCFRAIIPRIYYYVSAIGYILYLMAGHLAYN